MFFNSSKITIKKNIPTIPAKKGRQLGSEFTASNDYFLCFPIVT